MEQGNLSLFPFLKEKMWSRGTSTLVSLSLTLRKKSVGERSVGEGDGGWEEGGGGVH